MVPGVRGCDRARDEMVGRALATLEKIAADFRGDADWSPALVDGPRVLGVESLSTDGTVLRLQVRTALNRKDDVSRELRRRIKLGFEHARIAMSQTHQVEFRGQVSSAQSRIRACRPAQQPLVRSRYVPAPRCPDFSRNTPSGTYAIIDPAAHIVIHRVGQKIPLTGELTCAGSHLSAQPSRCV